MMKIVLVLMIAGCVPDTDTIYFDDSADAGRSSDAGRLTPGAVLSVVPDDGAGGSGGNATATDAGAACAHDKCTVGVPLDPSCDPCVAAICGTGYSCCLAGSSWSKTCVELVAPPYCDTACPTP